MTLKVKKHKKAGGGLRTLVAVLIIFVLAAAIFVGLQKSSRIQESTKFVKSSWDKKAAFAVALNTSPSSVVVFQRDIKRITFLMLAEGTYFVTGRDDEPIAKIGDAVEDNEIGQIAKTMSLSLGADIRNFAKFKDKKTLDEKTAQQIFKDFASLATPFVIAITGKPSFIVDTNITRLDAFRLWWQVKGIRVDSVKVTDLSYLREEIVTKEGEKVLGVDTVVTGRKSYEYFANASIESERADIQILNYSQSVYAAELASRFIESAGGKVVSIKDGGGVRENTQVSAPNKGSYTSKYLARMFECDIRELVSRDLEKRELVSRNEIKEAQENGDTAAITVALGKDFRVRYFK